MILFIIMNGSQSFWSWIKCHNKGDILNETDILLPIQFIDSNIELIKGIKPSSYIILE